MTKLSAHNLKLQKATLSEMSLMPLDSFRLETLSLVFITLLHMITSILPSATASISGNETDRLALLEFKSNVIHDPQGAMSSWNESIHFCEWQGVTCGHRHRRVTALNVSSKGLVGSLSPYVGNLSFLRDLMLYNNTLQGEIPPQLGQLFRLQRLYLTNNSFEGEIPANLSHCYSLTRLRVDGNSLVGKLPQELGSLSSLKHLVIHENYLTGEIPPSIANLTSLESLSALQNHFTGHLPDGLGQLKQLSQIGLCRNNFSGMIPPSIYNLSLLTIISLCENQLQGSLPPSFGFMLPHLQLLQLWGNQFSGTLPLSLSNCSDLYWLELQDNNFNGKIAVDFGVLNYLWRFNLENNRFGSGEPDELNFISSMTNCSNLEVLGIGYNQFRGMLPNSVGNLTRQLIVLSVGGNFIHGNLPSAVCNLVNLNSLSLDNSQFTGTIPSNIGNLQSLQLLDLRTNKFSGEIPFSIGNLSLLVELYMQNNRLEGNIPSSLGNCKKLLNLDLSQNNLSGAIPKQLLRISGISILLNLARNHLSGSLPSDVGNLKNLVELDISENELSGEIPSNLDSCTSLQNLYMMGNFFNGSIPLSLSYLRGLQHLDLSRNNLSGRIPTFFDQFSLKNLNLSFNDFEGEVPMGGVFANVSAISIVGNNKLCGGIPDLQLPKCSVKESKKWKRSLAFILVVSIASTLLSVIMLSCFLFCWFKKTRKAQPSISLLKESLVKVSYEILLKATNRFSSANLVGVGSYGTVYKGILNQDDRIVAIKVLHLQHRGASKSFIAECEAMRNIRHRNLVKVITSCSSIDFQGNDFKALVYEFMPNGSLERWLYASPKTSNGQSEMQSLNMLQRINIAIDVAFAVEYLHHHCEIPIIHCDLKPSNILLDSDMVAHVGDFGLAIFLQQCDIPNQCSTIGVRGTIGYTAPEYGLGSEVSTKGDVYSYGILLLEMMTGKKPVDSMFKEGLNLHMFARMALPDRVMEIVDPMLLNIDEEEASEVPNINQIPRESRNDNRKECLISMIKIGVACSMESPQDRMDISDVVHELNLVNNILQGTRRGPNA